MISKSNPNQYIAAMLKSYYKVAQFHWLSSALKIGKQRFSLLLEKWLQNYLIEFSLGARS